MGIGYGTCQRILTAELSMHHVVAKFVPRILIAAQKQQHVNVCEKLHQIASDNATFLSRVITGDESCIYGYDPETMQQFSQWNGPNSLRPKKTRQVKSKVKSMLIIFFDIKGTVHREFILAGQTVSSAYYCDVLRRLRENMLRLHLKLWRQKNWLLHHNNALSHTSFFTRKFLTKNMTVIPHPPYSPDLDPCDFSLFPQLKIKLKGRRFHAIEMTEAESPAVLNILTGNDFQDAFNNGRNARNSAYVQKGTTLRVTVASRTKVSF
jgi:histone-lysine N-methyltransferase SETMAR